MRRSAALLVLLLSALTPAEAHAVGSGPGHLVSPFGPHAPDSTDPEGPGDPTPLPAVVEARLQDDLASLAMHRPGYPFWTYIFRIPDGAIAFGSAENGRLLASFPTRGDWSREGRWEDATLRSLLDGHDLPSRLDDRRDEVARLFEETVGPVVHNPTRADFLTPNARRYGAFLDEWGRIYERFGIPAELGLAQAIVESGLNGEVKSEARAIGFCQWLPRNWERLQALTSQVIEVENQTTQAAFCAAHLTVLATKYGSFIPALSEHHAGAANVGRTLYNGGRLGADGVRERYFTGGRFAIDLRSLSPRTFRDVLGTYGPRSFLYSEMVFGNMGTVEALRQATPQVPIHALRVSRAIPFEEVVWSTGLSRDEVKRFNPALVRRVPKHATLYLPAPVEGLGTDVAFWHRDAPAAFTAVLEDFLALDAGHEAWEDMAFEPVLDGFRRRFRETDTEEGLVMEAVIGYVMEEIPPSRRVLVGFRSDPRVDRLFEEGVRLRAQPQSSSPGTGRPR